MNFKDFCDIVLDNRIVTTQEEFDETSQTCKKICAVIKNYVNKHGDIVLSCGSEQIDALTLVGNILDTLSIFAESGGEEDYK